MVECLFTNLVVVGSNPVAVTGKTNENFFRYIKTHYGEDILVKIGKLEGAICGVRGINTCYTFLVL